MRANQKPTDGWDWVGVPDAMTPDAAMLLDGIAAAGYDETPRLVYADYLDECGRAEWAALIRRQVADLAACDLASNKSGRRCTWPLFYTVRGKLVRTADLLVAAPWQSPQRHGTDLRNRNTATIELASSTYGRTRHSGTVYPRAVWHRGFLSAVRWVSPLSVFRFAESGGHAWHPWDAVPDDRLEDYEVRCGTAAEAGYDPESQKWCFFVSRRARGSGGRVRWTVGAQDMFERFNSLNVIPEPIARFLTGTLVILSGPNSGVPHAVTYPLAADAYQDVSRACRLFLAEAARQSRARVVARGIM
jgi:uncharacterized protein (TIGR02996 family)